MSDQDESPVNSDGEDSPLAELKRTQNKEKKDLRGKIFISLNLFLLSTS